MEQMTSTVKSTWMILTFSPFGVKVGIKHGSSLNAQIHTLEIGHKMFVLKAFSKLNHLF